jgi:hypothetical protein
MVNKGKSIARRCKTMKDRSEKNLITTKSIKDLTPKQIKLIERARKISGSAKVSNPSKAVETINELRGKDTR